MTNEKAIMCLEDMKIKVPIPKAAKQARENNEALDVAIKALQPANTSETPNSSDVISRQQAIEYFVNNVGFNDEYGYPIEDTDELSKIWTEYFDGIPSAQPKRKTGHWINGYKRQTCSICKQRGYRSWNFCPNCGADMRQKGENSEND